MTALSDTLTISLVLVLLFGSIALYLYTRIQQAEQRINLLESILLELKMSSEVKAYDELPASIGAEYDNESLKYTQSAPSSLSDYKPFDEEEEDDDSTSTHSSQQSKQSSVKATETNQSDSVKETVDDVEFYKSVLDSAVKDDNKQSTKLSVNYESMNIKELHSLAKQRGITGATVMKKQAIIEALKTSDRSSSSSVEPGSLSGVSSSFLETSSFLEKSDDVPTGTFVIDE